MAIALIAKSGVKRSAIMTTSKQREVMPMSNFHNEHVMQYYRQLLKQRMENK
ncbi:putative anticodon nuclease activator [Hafnia phage Pocis76]|uniref:Putative anticodon nuclease activator n=1 Tax=Hafnia phage Pocis76 TaxID=2831174 RepID=A0A8E7KXZ9_9CAUD|nr:putative anticodon nuclease activator [Hafnia phage Pocis76]